MVNSGFESKDSTEKKNLVGEVNQLPKSSNQSSQNDPQENNSCTSSDTSDSSDSSDSLDFDWEFYMLLTKAKLMKGDSEGRSVFFKKMEEAKVLTESKMKECEELKKQMVKDVENTEKKTEYQNLMKKTIRWISDPMICEIDYITHKLSDYPNVKEAIQGAFGIEGMEGLCGNDFDWERSKTEAKTWEGREKFNFLKLRKILNSIKMEQIATEEEARFRILSKVYFKDDPGRGLMKHSEFRDQV